LRECLSLGAERTSLVLCDADAVAPDSSAAALAAALRAHGPFDLLIGAGGANQEGAVARLTAAALGVPFRAAADGVELRPWSVSGHLAGLGRAVEATPWPATSSLRTGSFAVGSP